MSVRNSITLLKGVKIGLISLLLQYEIHLLMYEEYCFFVEFSHDDMMISVAFSEKFLL